MTSAAESIHSVGESLLWARQMLDYTDKVCAAVPAEAYSLRAEDPSGAYMFSAGELIAHIADSRWSVVDWIEGSEQGKARAFSTKYGGTKEPWEFRAATPEEIISSLSDGRVALDEIFTRPLASLLETTPGLIKSHTKRLERMKTDGKDTAEEEVRGPQIMLDPIIFLMAHEQSHRGTLQHMLRAAGVAVLRFA